VGGGFVRGKGLRGGDYESFVEKKSVKDPRGKKKCQRERGGKSSRRREGGRERQVKFLPWPASKSLQGVSVNKWAKDWPGSGEGRNGI